MDITRFLDNLGLGKYTQQFIDNDIDLSILGRMSESHFRELGISMGHRLVLIDALARQSIPAGSEMSQATEITASESALFSAAGERRQLSVMFVDLVGSTLLSERVDPEDLSDIFRTYQKICGEIVDRYQATIAKYSGDGILIYFGYPTAHENDVERALRAGLQMIDAFRQREIRPGIGLELRIGVATGLVVVGETIGENSSEEQVVVGETPNLAARLQSLAEPNTLVVSHRSRQLVGSSFSFTDLGEKTLKGFSTPQRGWRVDATHVKIDRYSTPMPMTTPRLLGRDEELNLLIKRWSWAREGEGQTVLLGGEAGIGKSRMVAAFGEHLAKNATHSPVVQLYHYCSDYHQNTFLHPVIDQWLQRMKILKLDKSEEMLHKLRHTLAVNSTLQEDDTLLLAELLEIPVEDKGSFSSLTQQFKQNRTMEVLTEHYIGFANSAPVLVVFEDIHWADPSTLDLIGRVINSSARYPIMLLLTHRSEFSSPWKKHSNVTQFSLSHLPKRYSNEMIRDICRSTTLDDELVRNITERADGIPLFVEELTKTAIEYSAEESATGGDQSPAPAILPINEIPASLQDSLLARLDRQASARRVAQMGAAFGREFEFLDIKALIDIDEQTLIQKLDELVQAEIVLPDGGSLPDVTYRFKHSLVRDAAYESMLKSVRRQLHRRIAEQLQDKDGFTKKSPEIIAEHWERAEDFLCSVEYWFRAGKRSKERFALAEAMSQLSRVVDIAEKEQCRSDEKISNTAAKALAFAGDIASLQDNVELANRQYEKALELSQCNETSIWIRNKRHIPKTTRRDGATIAYDVHGNGSETIVLGTAMMYGLGTLQPVLEELCQEYRVITIQPRGCGNSDPVVRPFPISEHVDDLAAIIRSATDEPVIAIGLSRAATTLIRLVSKEKGLVKKLVTVGCPCKPEYGQGGLANPKTIALREKAYQEQDIDSLVEMLQGRILTEPGTDELRIRSIELRRKLPVDTILSFFDPDPSIDITGLLPHIDIPVQIIHGAEDQQVVLESARHMAKLLPDSSLHTIAHAGHIPMITATLEFCDLVKRFINDHESGPKCTLRS